MNDAKKWQTFLKVVSILLIVVCVIGIAVGALLSTSTLSGDFAGVLVGAQDLPDGLPVSADAVVSVGGGFFIVYYAIDLIATLIVLRGALNPAKIKPALVVAGIFAVLSVIQLVGVFTSSGSLVTSVVSVVFQVLLFIGCLQVSKQTR